jgi:lysophospholipase L1-like esterase
MRFVQRSFCVTALLSASLCLACQPTLAQATSAQVDPSSSTTAQSDPAVVPTSRLSEPAWADHHNAILAALPSHADTQVLLIGDSITDNYNKSSPPSEDFQPIWEQYYAPRHALNLGFGGDTTGNVLWRLDHGEVAGLHPKLAILLIGTNNTAQHQTAQQTEAGIDAVVADIERQLPETKILLLGILPSRLPSKDTNFDVNSYLGSRYAGHADPKVTYLDVGSIFYTRGALNDALFYDPQLKPPQPALHPTPIGQRLLASAIEPTVARLLDQPPVPPTAVPLPAPPHQP